MKYFMGLTAESQSQLLLWSDSCSIINLRCCHGMKYIDVGTQLCYKYLILWFFKDSQLETWAFVDFLLIPHCTKKYLWRRKERYWVL